MKIACLTPTYGRPTLVDGLVAMFEWQDHPVDQRRLLIYDDADQLEGEGEGWKVWSRKGRELSMPAKYNRMLGWLNEWWPEWEAVAIMDDDDIYGPHYLSSHARALRERGRLWSHPLGVWSLYSVNVLHGQRPILESSGGRFWSSAVVKRELIERCGGFVESKSVAFDQEHLALWRRLGGEPGRPDMYAEPQYVYGWGRPPHHESVIQQPANGWQPLMPKHGPDHHVVSPKADGVIRVVYKMLFESPNNDGITRI